MQYYLRHPLFRRARRRPARARLSSSSHPSHPSPHTDALCDVFASIWRSSWLKALVRYRAGTGCAALAPLKVSVDADASDLPQSVKDSVQGLEDLSLKSSRGERSQNGWNEVAAQAKVIADQLRTGQSTRWDLHASAH